MLFLDRLAEKKDIHKKVQQLGVGVVLNGGTRCAIATTSTHNDCTFIVDVCKMFWITL